MFSILDKQTNRIIIALILGIVIALAFCYFAIGLGYNQIKDVAIAEYSVQLFGFSIYDIKEINGKVSGSANNNNMMFIGIILSMILVMITELIFSKKSNKKASD